MVAVELEDVRKGYAEGGVALDGVSLAVQDGRVLVLLGTSGSGKTTTLKVINRLVTLDSGRASVLGRDLAAWDPIALRRRIGYVIQEVGLLPHLSVADNVWLVPQLLGWADERRRERIRELLALVGLDPGAFGSLLPRQLSGGQRQRVGIARALAADPPLLLMDEPFGALDPLTRAELHAEFRRIQERLRKTVIIVSHDMGEAFALADRVGVIDEGRLVACDRPSAMAASREPRVRQMLDALPVVPRS